MKYLKSCLVKGSLLDTTIFFSMLNINTFTMDVILKIKIN